MHDFNKVNEIATEDAAEALHELGEKDFIDVFAKLVVRRSSNLKEVNLILDKVFSAVNCLNGK